MSEKKMNIHRCECNKIPVVVYDNDKYRVQCDCGKNSHGEDAEYAAILDWNKGFCYPTEIKGSINMLSGVILEKYNMTLEEILLVEKINDEEEKQEIERNIRERQLKDWKYRGMTNRYIDSTWDNWEADTPEKITAKDYAKTAWFRNMFFSGGNGTGKTHLAMCLVKDGAMYRRISDIFREVRLDFDSEDSIIDYYSSYKLLILDEVGRQKFSDFEKNLFFEIIDRRWNNVLPTTVITNLTPQEFAEAYGAAVLDRLRPRLVKFNWDSMRKII